MGNGSPLYTRRRFRCRRLFELAFTVNKVLQYTAHIRQKDLNGSDVCGKTSFDSGVEHYLSSRFLFDKPSHNPGSGLQILADRLTLCCGLNRSRGVRRTPAINNRILGTCMRKDPVRLGGGICREQSNFVFSCRIFIYACLRTSSYGECMRSPVRLGGGGTCHCCRIFLSRLNFHSFIHNYLASTLFLG